MVVAEIPNDALTDEAPVYHRPLQKPKHVLDRHKSPSASRTDQLDFDSLLLRFLASPNLASKEWVYQQYDHMVRTNTVQLPGADAAVIRIKGTDKALRLHWMATVATADKIRTEERRLQWPKLVGI